MVVLIISIVIFVLYLTLVLVFVVGWKRTPDYVLDEHAIFNSETSVSVVIACKNEEANLPNLLLSLKNQKFNKFELVLVNDHSDDSTRQIMEEAKLLFSNLIILDADTNGKKRALEKGILAANGELIVVTDADCLPGLSWLMVVYAFYQQHPSDLIICPVQLSNSTSVLDRLQALEFITLVGAGAGAAGAGFPILCNGANLAFKKDVWKECAPDLEFGHMSGDDIFLMQSINKRGGVIRFLKSKSALVFTAPTKAFSSFFKQRKRWASKSPYYSDIFLIATACVVFAISFWILVLFSISFFSTLYAVLALSLFTLKFLVDLCFMYTIRSFFGVRNPFIDSFLLSILYPFYIVGVSIFALFSNPKSWK